MAVEARHMNLFQSKFITNRYHNPLHLCSSAFFMMGFFFFFFLFSLWNPIFSDLGFDFLAEISWNSIREIPTCTIPRWILCCLRLQQCLKRFHLITNLLIAAIWVVQPRPSWTRLIVDSPMLSLSLISESVLEIQSMTSMLYQSVKKPTKSQACHLFSTRTLSSRFINNNQRSIASLPNM